MSDQMKRWLIGLANAGISAAATNFGGFVAGVDWKKALLASILPFVVSLVKWLVQHPIPGGIEGQ